LKHATFLAAAVLLWTAPALAHVGLHGPVFANTTQVLTFTVGHGCDGADTSKVEIRIPAGVTSIRALPGAFGNGVVTKDESGAVTAITWTRAAADVLADDSQFYEVKLRARTPDAAFTTLAFPTVQTCRSAAGVETVVEWVGTGGHDGDEEPAPSTTLLPARRPGWNKFTVPVALADLTAFADAQIVWAAQAAYSPNPEIAALIAAEAGVTTLTAIPAGTSVWVKY